MYDVNNYLSYTHGTTLFHLCEEILNQNTDSRKVYTTWILKEMESLRKNQSVVWETPVSTSNYYGFLEMLLEILKESSCYEMIADVQRQIKEMTREKIHALFLTQESFCWPSLESVFKAAQESSAYEATLVYTPFFHKNYTEQVDYYPAYQEMGLPVLRHDQYDLSQDSPDVVFVIKPYENIPQEYTIPHLLNVVPRLVYIAYGMEITTDLIKYAFQHYGHYAAWRHCAYGQVVKEYGTQYGYRNGENIAVWGHPKADYFRNMDQNRENIPAEWKQRIGSRKTILWTPHHLIDLSGNGTGTWLLWGEDILDLALNNPDIFFIVRPHPLMMGALVNSGAMTQEQAEQLREKIDSAENMLWDTNDDYRIAFDAADAIITDGTTFSVEFLYTKKPIFLTPRNMEGFYHYEDMMESYYICDGVQSVSNFMMMIKNGEDPLKEKRNALYDKMFYIPENCTVGENVVQQVKTEIEKECIEMVSEMSTGVNTEVDERSFENDIQFPLMTILVLCYKNQELLYGMLDSIFMQDYPRIQLVVSDDGSEQFDIAKIENYISLHKRDNIEEVIVRSNPVNMRTVRHIHAAMDYVKGDYLVFTAADDRFSGRGTISMYVEQFLRQPEKKWLVAKCRVTSPDYMETYHYLPAQKDVAFFEADDASVLFSRWARRGLAIPCCMAFRTDAIQMVGGFDLDYLFIEDWPLELKLLRSGHAPIFCNQVTALHSSGGVTNSNQRYGKETRRLFYEDKYTLFRKEVQPYLHLLTPEDRKAYKHYMREIMERHYFLNIDWADSTRMEKIKALIKKPMGLMWLVELKLVDRIDNIPKKKILALSQILLLMSVIFLNVSSDNQINLLFNIIGYVYLVAGFGSAFVGILLYFFQKRIHKKSKLRSDLVN